MQVDPAHWRLHCVCNCLEALAVRERRCRYADRVSMANGISAVPAVIINQRDLMSGGQPVDVSERALRQIAQASDAQ